MHENGGFHFVGWWCCVCCECGVLGGGSYLWGGGFGSKPNSVENPVEVSMEEDRWWVGHGGLGLWLERVNHSLRKL